MLKFCEPAIFEKIKNVTPIVVAMRAPDNEEGPFIIYQRTDRDTTPKRTLNRTAGIAGMVMATLQIDCYDSTYDGAKNLAADVEDILDGFSGTVNHGTDSPQAFVEIRGVTLLNDTDILDQTEEPLLYRVSTSYLVTYKQ